MSQLAFDFDKRQSVANGNWGIYVCEYCGRDWGNRVMYDINCHYDNSPTWNGMCGTEFWNLSRAGKL